MALASTSLVRSRSWEKRLNVSKTPSIYESSLYYWYNCCKFEGKERFVECTGCSWGVIISYEPPAYNYYFVFRVKEEAHCVHSFPCVHSSRRPTPCQKSPISPLTLGPPTQQPPHPPLFNPNSYGIIKQTIRRCRSRRSTAVPTVDLNILLHSGTSFNA